jgi:hypothetical protein
MARPLDLPWTSSPRKSHPRKSVERDFVVVRSSARVSWKRTTFGSCKVTNLFR